MGDTDRGRRPDPLVLIGKDLLGRYSIVERLAQGGMSVVYRAVDERLQRPVCVKVFFGLDRSRQSYQTTYEHFVQEAFALSQLQHPNTIRIYDFGYLVEEPQSPFHVSELMDGGTLLGLVRREGALTADDTLEILEPIAGALAEAHSRGIVHRDIKPTNILFGSAGPRRIVKLADFGIAKAHLEEGARGIPNRAQDTQNADGQKISLYSPGWAAPEQLRAAPVAPSADVFALGLLVAFMLTGRKVFADSDLLKVIEDRFEGDAYTLHALEELQLPRRVTDVLGRACRVDPRQRYDGVDELVAELRAAFAAPDQVGSAIRTKRFDRPEGFTGRRGEGEVQSAERPANADPSPPPQLPVQPPAAEPVLVLAALTDGEAVAGGRRVRLVPVGETIDLGGAADAFQGPARIRLTFLPGADGRTHVRGLNCFVRRPGGRPTSAVDVDAETTLELLAPDRQPLDAVRIVYSRRVERAAHFALGGVTLAVPDAAAAHPLVLDFGPGRDLVLVYRTVRRVGDP